MNTTWIRVAYGVVLGLVLVGTVAFGVLMVEPGPEPPQDPGITFLQLSGGGESEQSQNRLVAAVDSFYDGARDYRDGYVTHQRTVFLAGASLAALLAVIGLALPAAVNFLRWGLLLGAAFALAWASWFALSAVPNPAPPPSGLAELLAAGEPEPLDFAGRFLRFAVSFVSLIILVFLGLWRLTEWPATRRAVVAVPAGGSAPPVAPVAGTWAPPAASTVPPVGSTSAPAASTVPDLHTVRTVETTGPATVTGTVPAVTDGSARAEAAPPAETMHWGRPDESGQPERRPDATP